MHPTSSSTAQCRGAHDTRPARRRAALGTDAPAPAPLRLGWRDQTDASTSARMLLTSLVTHMSVSPRSRLAPRRRRRRTGPAPNARTVPPLSVDSTGDSRARHPPTSGCARPRSSRTSRGRSARLARHVVGIAVSADAPLQCHGCSEPVLYSVGCSTVQAWRSRRRCATSLSPARGSPLELLLSFSLLSASSSLFHSHRYPQRTLRCSSTAAQRLPRCAKSASPCVTESCK
ncbi:hypothetical protein FA09DRAFT_163474 [Tilletiopsis washingtonensis]|uniref:Uncharacterized protein n=1 Tax=Tilletiopsis washingtonensis TaxID=58919 RepID=A0A316YZP9_9BASI|nr:hypothetical protein FA09DRAFT_163474 [Tilletiopsis washingtonensis]PWN94927.1 hypothetical protein FA09DRAFT_163474 [Tilletiopsis washingtonensis]